MSVITIDKDGNLTNGGVSINLDEFLDLLETKPTIFVQTEAPTDFKIGDFWYDTKEDVFAIGRIVNGMMCWVEVPFGIEIDDTLLSTSSSSSGGDVTTSMLDAAIGAVRQQILALDIKNEDGVIKNNNGEDVYNPVKDKISGFKNKIYNGAMTLSSYGKVFDLTDGEMEILDNWYSSIQGGSVMTGKKFLYSPTEGSQMMNSDLLGDGTIEAHFPFFGDIKDYTGKHDDAKFINTAGDEVNPMYADTALGTVLNFDGAHGINFPNADIWGAGNAVDYDIGISAWVNMKEGSDFVVYSTGGTSNNLGFGIRNNRIYACTQDDDTFKTLYGDVVLNNTWNHLAMDYDGVTHEVRLYLNTKLVASATMTLIDARNSNGWIGGGAYVGDSFFDSTDDSLDFPSNGYISRLRFYKNRKFDILDDLRKLYVESDVFYEKFHAISVVYENNNISTYIPYKYKFDKQELNNALLTKNDLSVSFDFLAGATGKYNVALINKSNPDKVETYISTFDYDKTQGFQRIKLTIPTSDFTINDDIRYEFMSNIELAIGCYGALGQEGYNVGEVYAASGTVVPDKGTYIGVVNVQLEEGKVVTDYSKLPDNLEKLVSKKYIDTGWQEFEYVNTGGSNYGAISIFDIGYDPIDYDIYLQYKPTGAYFKAGVVGPNQTETSDGKDFGIIAVVKDGQIRVGVGEDGVRVGEAVTIFATTEGVDTFGEGDAIDADNFKVRLIVKG